MMNMPRFKTKHLLFITTLIAITVWVLTDHSGFSELFTGIAVPILSIFGVGSWIERWRDA